MRLTESHRHQVQVAQTRVARAYEEAMASSNDGGGQEAKAQKCTEFAKSLVALADAYATVPGEGDERGVRALTLCQEKEALAMLAFTGGTALECGWGLAEFLFECVSMMEPEST